MDTDERSRRLLISFSVQFLSSAVLAVVGWFVNARHRTGAG
jgi:hypothetical protein